MANPLDVPTEVGSGNGKKLLEAFLRNHIPYRVSRPSVLLTGSDFGEAGSPAKGLVTAAAFPQYGAGMLFEWWATLTATAKPDGADGWQFFLQDTDAAGEVITGMSSAITAWSAGDKALISGWGLVDPDGNLAGECSFQGDFSGGEVLEFATSAKDYTANALTLAFVARSTWGGGSLGGSVAGTSTVRLDRLVARATHYQTT